MTIISSSGLFARPTQETGKEVSDWIHVTHALPRARFLKSPLQRELFSGILTCDLIGLHTDEYKRNFIACCALGLEIKFDRNNIEYQGHKTHTETFIRGIDPQKFSNGLLGKDVKKRAEELAGGVMLAYIGQ